MIFAFASEPISAIVGRSYRISVNEATPTRGRPDQT